MQLVKSLTVDIHRLGSLSEEGVVRKGEGYIALCGTDEPAVKCEMQLGHEEFLRLLHELRYPSGGSAERVDEALDRLGRLAADLLPASTSPPGTEAVQIDLVLGAAELWAFPFEACTRDEVRVFCDARRPLVLTRRIRQGFAAEKQPWPVRPRVLFVHAPAARDLAQDLIDDHRQALEEALMPWSAKSDPRADGLLEVVLALGVRDVEKAVRRAREAGKPYTHVHVLAHGKAIRDPVTDALRWGLRLGDESRAAAEAEDIAEPLAPLRGLPVVVTLAACDAGNQAATAVPRRSFAQALHARGVPIVLAPQFPLTQPGSVTMTRSFYRHLLGGEDARWALHQSRLDLRDDPDAGHDWISLTGYIQLPEGYADHLIEVGIQRDMARLRAARDRLVRAMEGGEESESEFDKIETEVAERIGSLEARLAVIPPQRRDEKSECHGILASGHKRLAELYFHRGRHALRPDDADGAARLEARSRDELRSSHQAYRSAYRADIQNHWLGVQQLSLAAVLDGRFEEPRVWDTVFFAAELDAASRENAVWPYGTLAELWLLAPLRGRERDLDEARRALERLDEQATRAGNKNAVPSTRDQLARYVDWWRKQNGYFGDRDDLAADAAELIEHLDQQKERSPNP